MNSVEITERKEALKQEARDLGKNAKMEIRNFNEDEQKRLAEIKTELHQLNEELRKLEETTEITTNNSNKTEKTKMEKRNFSLTTAIRNVVNHKNQDEFTQSIIDAGREEMRATGNENVGQIVLPSEYRAVTKSTEGADIVATDLFDIAGAIHSKSVLAALGCNIMSGLVNDVQLPVIDPLTTVSWESEIAEKSDDTPTFKSVKLAPKRLSAVVPVSKMLLAQDSAGIENALRNEITKAIMGKLEATVFGNAAGDTTKPQGIFYTTGSLTQISDYSDICEFEGTLDGKDITGNMKYVMAPNVKAALRGMIKGTNGTGMVFEGGEVDGTPAEITGFVGTGKLAYGAWDNLVVGLWNGTDILVDEYTLASQGMIRLVVNFYCDAKLRREGTIAVATI